MEFNWTVHSKCPPPSWSVRETDSVQDIFFEACSHGDIQVLEWLRVHQRFKKVKALDNEGFRRAARHGQLKVLQWLVIFDRFTVNDVRACDNEAFRLAAGNGHLNVLQWLIQEFNLTLKDAMACDNEAFISASYYGHVHVQKWLKDFGVTIDHLIKRRVAPFWRCSPLSSFFRD